MDHSVVSSEKLSLAQISDVGLTLDNEASRGLTLGSDAVIVAKPSTLIVTDSDGRNVEGNSVTFDFCLGLHVQHVYAHVRVHG